MNRPRIVLPRALPEDWLAPLRDTADVVMGPADRAGFAPHVLDALEEADGLLTLLTERVDDAVLDRAPHLRVVSNMAVGVDNIDLEACHRRGIAIGHTPGVLTEATADLTMALLLSAARKLSTSAKDAREGRWGTWSPTGWLGADLHDATLGIVGLGKIGSAVARRAHAFGMQIVYATRTPTTSPIPNARAVDLETLLRESDFVSLHAPLTEHTRGLIDANALATMKPTALLINTARGPLVEGAALANAVRNGTIAGAALDVTDPEPLPPDDPLYALDDVLIVPHIGSATVRTRRRMASLAIDNVIAGVRGDPLPHGIPNPDA